MLNKNRMVKKLSGMSILVGILSHLPTCASANDWDVSREIKILQASDRILAEPIFDEKHHFKANQVSPTPLEQSCGKAEYSPDEVRRIAVAAAAKYNVPEDIVLNVIAAESDFERKRNSPKGARGAMQLMPKTAMAFGVTDVCDTVQNIEGGTKFLKQLLEKYGSVKLALAAYNAGETVVDRAGGVPAIEETQKYVNKITAKIPPVDGGNEKAAGIIIGAAAIPFKNGVFNFNGERKNENNR